MIVKCIKNEVPRYHDEFGPYDWQLKLIVGREYRVISIEYDNYRIMNEPVGPCLYPPEAFEIADPSPGDDWGPKVLNDGAVHWGPPEFDRRGFWEAYHDGDERAIEQVHAYLRRFE